MSGDDEDAPATPSERPDDPSRRGPWWAHRARCRGCRCRRDPRAFGSRVLVQARNCEPCVRAVRAAALGVRRTKSRARPIVVSVDVATDRQTVSSFAQVGWTTAGALRRGRSPRQFGWDVQRLKPGRRRRVRREREYRGASRLNRRGGGSSPPARAKGGPPLMACPANADAGSSSGRTAPFALLGFVGVTLRQAPRVDG